MLESGMGPFHTKSNLSILELVHIFMINSSTMKLNLHSFSRYLFPFGSYNHCKWKRIGVRMVVRS